MTLDLHSNGLVRLALGPIHWVPGAGGKKGFAVWHTAIQDRPVEIWVGLPALSTATGRPLGTDERKIRAALLECCGELERRACEKARPGQRVIVLDDAELSGVDWSRTRQ